MAQIVIIGAGLTGLSTAYHLEQLGFYDYKLFEKESTCGGLCRSIKSNNFTFDYTGHLLHINDNYFEQFIKNTIGFDNLNSINRRSFIYSKDKYTRYPYQINLYGLPEDTIVESIEEFVKRDPDLEDNNFYNWVLKHFGAGLGKNFFFPYQKKIFQYDIKKLTTSWMGRFVPKTSLKDLITGAIKDRSEESFGYNSKFFYPKKDGIEAWVKTIEKKLKNPIYKTHEVCSIDSVNKIINFKNNKTEKYKILINTMPLDIFLNIIKEPSNKNLKVYSKKLLCNTVVNFNLGINRSDLSQKHWIYFPEEKYSFYRIGFPHNFSNYMAPKNCSSLYGEFSYLNKAENLDIILGKSLKQVKQLFNIQESEILSENIIKIKHAYVIYNKWREDNLDNIINALNDINIQSIGRYGQWKYSSMQEAILDGKQAAKQITENLKLNSKNRELKKKLWQET